MHWVWEFYFIFFSESISGTSLEVAGFMLSFHFFPLVKAHIKKKKILFPLALLMLLGDK